MAAAKPSLLVVDDEADLVQSVKDLLRFDYRVLGATRASEGLKLLRDEPVQIVMSDQRMPEMTGVEFLRRIKEVHPHAVRLLFTAYADLSAVIDAINQGSVYRYIAKPWQADELKAVLRQAVDHYNLQAEKRRLLQEVQRQNAQLEAANAELQRANDLKRAFIKVASHELRTPLTIMVGLSELAAKSPATADPVRGWVEQVHKAGLRLGARVDQMVKLLQAERYDRSLEPRDADLAELLRGAAAEVRSFIEQRRQALALDLPADLGTVHVEPDKLRDAVVQLLMNAIKFTPDGGTVRLTAAHGTDGGTTITLADTGMGMDERTRECLFQPFFTGFDVSRHCSGTFEYDRRGLGLGLSVAKAFIEMHGGRITVDSEVGRGTTFTITLPPAAA